MRKYQWVVILALISFVFAFVSCNRMQKVLQPTMPDPQPIEMVEMPVEEIPQDEGIGIFDTSVMAGHGLLTEVYVPGGRLTHVPDFDTLTPFRTYTVANIDVPNREYTQGFPDLGIDVLEDFAIRLRGRLKVETAGTYGFTLNSDDGSKLYIDGSLVIDNDGLHPMRAMQGSTMLAAGFHDIEIQYFQGPRTHIGLQWFWQPPGSVNEIVPPGVLYPPDMTATPVDAMLEPVPQVPTVDDSIPTATDPSLILYFSFDELDGNWTIDHSQYENQGRLVGNPQLVDGKFGKALEFNGETDAVEVPHHSSLNVTEAVTVMAWIYTPRQNHPRSNWQGILAKGDQHPRSYSFYTERGGTLQLALDNSAATTIVEVDGVPIQHSEGNIASEGTFELNEWQHVAGRIANGERQFWINGQRAGTSEVVTPFPGFADTASVLIGDTHETNRNFQGMIDEVRIWNRALSEDEILEQMGQGLTSQ